MDITNKQIKIGAMMSYFTIIFNIIAGFIYTPWMVVKIGQSDYGLYTLALSVIHLFLMDFGISGAISRFISYYRAKGEENKVSELLGITYKLYFLIDVAIFLILIVVFCFIKNIFVRLTPAEIDKLRVVFIIVGFFNLISFLFTPLNGILISYEKFVVLKICELLNKFCSILLIFGALSLGFGLYTLVMINALVNIIIILNKFIYIKKKVYIKTDLYYRNPALLKQILNFSAWITIISIAQRLILNITPGILGIFSGTIQISIFTIGMTLEGYTWTFANALNGLFLSKVTRLTIQEQKTEQITDLMIKIGRIQIVLVGIIWIGLFFMGKEFLVLWMGKSFENSYYVMLFLTLPGIVTLTQEIAYNYLVAINEIKYRAYDFIGTALISITLSLILTPKFGAVGAALAAGTGVIFGHVIVMNIIYYRIFHLDIMRFFKECHFKMVKPFLLTSIVSIVLQKFIPAINLYQFALKVFIVIIFYILFIWLLGLNIYEKNMFLSFLKPLKNKFLKVRIHE